MFRNTSHQVGLLALAGIVLAIAGCNGGSSGDFIFANRPTVTAVNPTTGPQTGGSTVTITGTNFDAAANVLIGGQSAFNIAVIDSQTITATTPLSSNTTTAVDVVVQNPLAQATLPGSFTYAAVTVNPNTGGVAGGDTVQIPGAGFNSTTMNTVFFGTTAGTGVTVIDDNTLSVITPNVASGTVDVTLTNDFGSSTIPNGFTFQVSIASITPGVASSAGGTTLTIVTSGFPDDFTTTTPSVTINGTNANNITALSMNTVTADVPMGLMTGQATVVVMGAAETASSMSLTIVAPAAQGDLLINEILADPGVGAPIDASRDGSADTVDDEFVELVNTRSTGIDISGFTISDGVGVRFTFPNPTTIPAGGAIVVFGTTGPSTPAFAPLHSSGAALSVGNATGLALNNGGDVVTVLDANTNLIATVTYGAAPSAESLNRDPDGDPNGVFVNHSTVTTPASVNDPTTGAPISPSLRADQTGF